MTHAQQMMGRDAATLLLQKINHHKVDSVVYESLMVERDSVRKLKE